MRTANRIRSSTCFLVRYLLMIRLFSAVLFLFSGGAQSEPPSMPKFQLVYLKWEWALEHKTEGTAKLANEWTQLLKTAQIEVMLLPMGPGRLMMMGEKLKRARKFVLEQSEVD